MDTIERTAHVAQLYAFLCDVRDEIVRASKSSAQTRKEPVRYLARRFGYAMQRYGQLCMAHDLGIRVSSPGELTRIRDEIESAWDTIIRGSGYSRLSGGNHHASFPNVCGDTESANSPAPVNGTAWV